MSEDLAFVNRPQPIINDWTKNPTRWNGVSSIVDTPEKAAAIAEAQKRAGRDLTYAEKRILIDALVAAQKK